MNMGPLAAARHPHQGLVRRLLILRAKTGKAPGLLYSFIERHGHEIADVERQRHLANDLILECDLRDHVQQQIYFFGAYEPIEATLFMSLIPPGGVAVDAGANDGVEPREVKLSYLSKATTAAAHIHAAVSSGA